MAGTPPVLVTRAVQRDALVMKSRFRVGMGLSNYDGENAQPWSNITNFYSELARANEVFRPLAELATALAESGFVEAGLCAVTSMHDLCLGPSKTILQNPHLRIAYVFDVGMFSLIYVDGSANPWGRRASPDHVFAIVSRFLTKRTRWYASRAHKSDA